MQQIKSFFKREAGQGLVEYGLIITLVAIAVLAGVKAFGDQVGALLSDTAGKLDAATLGGEGSST